MWIPLSVRCPPTPNTERPTGTPNSWDTTPWWRCGQRPQEILHSRLRGGSSQKGAAHFVVEAVNRVRRAGAAGPLTVRADSGFWSYRLIADLDRLRVEWSITIPQHSQVKTAIAAIEDTAWKPIDYPKGGVAQVAETAITASRKGNRRRVRVVVRRTRLTDPVQAPTVARLAIPRLRHQHRTVRCCRGCLLPGPCPSRTGDTRHQSPRRAVALPVRELLRQRRLASLRHPRSQPLPVDRTTHPPGRTTNQRKTLSAPDCSDCPEESSTTDEDRSCAYPPDGHGPTPTTHTYRCP